MEEWELEELFEKYGEIRSIVLQRDQDTGLPRGTAFVNFTDIAPAEKAIEELEGESFKGRALRMSHPLRKMNRRAQRHEDPDRYRY